jgi:hypothetical protein
MVRISTTPRAIGIKAGTGQVQLSFLDDQGLRASQKAYRSPRRSGASWVKAGRTDEDQDEHQSWATRIHLKLNRRAKHESQDAHQVRQQRVLLIPSAQLYFRSAPREFKKGRKNDESQDEGQDR